MRAPLYLPIVLLAALFGSWPVAGPFLYELALEQGHGRHVAASVVMYGTRWCPSCRRAREYLERHGFDYVEHDIEANEQNMANFRALGGYGVPLIVVGDRRTHGFSPRALEALLE